MKQGTILVALLLLSAMIVAAQAEFTEVNGKVEIRPAGGGSWRAAEVGMTVEDDTMISTGFNATAAIAMGASTVTVEQLTRMVFEEIVERSDSVETRLNLNVGRMSAKVRSSDGRAQDFRVRSPISTAAVRGTEFSYDGEELDVVEGEVLFVNTYGQQRSVSGGQTSTTTGEPGAPSNPKDEAKKNGSTSSQPLGSGSDDEGDGPADDDSTGDTPDERSTRGIVVIEVQ